MEKKNKRTVPRNPTEAVIACWPFTSSRATHTSDGVMRNFSKEGSYIETASEFKSGTILLLRMVQSPSMSLALAAEERPRSIGLAEVKWRQELVDGNTIQYGLGLRYLD